MSAHDTNIVLTQTTGRITVTLRAVFMGPDLCVLITGGEAPHLGAVSCTSPEHPVETVRFVSHKEYHVTEMFAEHLRAVFGGNVAVLCGIHVDNITKEEIDETLALCRGLLSSLCARLKEETR
jgi:hypothetical protein